MYSLSIIMWRSAGDNAPGMVPYPFYSGENGEKVGKILRNKLEYNCDIELYLFPAGRYSKSEYPSDDDMCKARSEVGKPIEIVVGTKFPIIYHVYEIGGVSHDEAYYRAKLRMRPWFGLLRAYKVFGKSKHSAFMKLVETFNLHDGVADIHEYNRDEVLRVFMARTDVPEEWREPIYMYLEEHLPLLVLE